MNPFLDESVVDCRFVNEIVLDESFMDENVFG